MYKYIVALLIAFSSAYSIAEAVSPAGTFSDLKCIKSQGDVLGIEISFIPAFNDSRYEYYALLQIAEGVAAKPEYVPVKIIHNKFSFLASYLGYFDVTVEGTISNDAITGKISALVKQDFELKRQPSFWSRGGFQCIR